MPSKDRRPDRRPRSRARWDRSPGPVPTTASRHCRKGYAEPVIWTSRIERPAQSIIHLAAGVLDGSVGVLHDPAGGARSARTRRPTRSKPGWWPIRMPPDLLMAASLRRCARALGSASCGAGRGRVGERAGGGRHGGVAFEPDPTAAHNPRPSAAVCGDEQHHPVTHVADVTQRSRMVRVVNRHPVW